MSPAEDGAQHDDRRTMTTQALTMRFTEMTAEQFQAHLDQRSVNTHDAARVASWFAADGVQRMVATGATASGRVEIEENMARLFEAFPDLHIQVRDLFTAGNRMCAQCTLTGTHEGEGLGFPATGRRVAYELCLVFRCDEDGFVEEEVVYADSATLLTQLGVLPSAAPS
jgi:steroid delta-isomerase-like uncharacterized protein